MVCTRYLLVYLAYENGPFIVEFTIKTPIYSGFSMAMLNNQMVWSGSWFSHDPRRKRANQKVQHAVDWCVDG